MLDRNSKERLLSLSTALVADAMTQFGLGGIVDPSIHPVVPFSRMAGTAVTVKFESIDTTESVPLTHYTKAMAMGKEYFDPVIVLELPRDRHLYGILGEGSATAARSTGFVGALIDGAARDSHELRDMGFPVFCRTLGIGFAFGKLATSSLNQPVTIGGVTVHAGDIVFADNDGALIIPGHDLSQVLQRAEEIKAWEHRFHAMLATGKTFEETGKLVGPMPGSA